MKRFIALTNIVLTFSLLMAGCGPTSTPAPLTEEPVSVLTREEAVESLMVEVIQPSPNADMLVAYGLQEPLSAGDVLQSLLPADSLSSPDLIGSPYSHGEAWFFWIDDQPQAGYAHPTRFVLVDLTTGAVEVTPEEWWPVINGDPCWDTQETRRDSTDIVYQGAHPYENENPESALQLVAYHVAAPLPADKTKYAILVRGANEGSPDNSVEAMKAQLIKDGFLQKNIKVVKIVKGQKEADPTGKVVKAFDDVAKQIKKDGTEEPKFLFYYVGHANKNAFVYGKKKESNCEILSYVQQSPNSVVKTDGSLANDSLASILLRIPSEDITVIIDACKSGTAIDDLRGWGFKGQILTGADRDGKVLWSGWNVGRTYFTGYLLEGREKWGSFWEGLNHAAYKCSKWLCYDDPKPQREKLKGDYKEITISGTVTDKDTGKPIPGATIDITATSPNGLDKITKHNIRADNTGRYKTAVRLIGYFTVEAKATGYKSDKKSEGLDADRPEFNFSLTQEMPTSTPTPTPSPTPTLIPTLTSTPTMTPTLAPTPTPMASIELEDNIDRLGMDYSNFDLPEADPELCWQACLKDSKCAAFTYVKPGIQASNARCWLKYDVPQPLTDDCCISGVKPSEP